MGRFGWEIVIEDFDRVYAFKSYTASVIHYQLQGLAFQEIERLIALGQLMVRQIKEYRIPAYYFICEEHCHVFNQYGDELWESDLPSHMRNQYGTHRRSRSQTYRNPNATPGAGYSATGSQSPTGRTVGKSPALAAPYTGRKSAAYNAIRAAINAGKSAGGLTVAFKSLSVPLTASAQIPPPIDEPAPACHPPAVQALLAEATRWSKELYVATFTKQFFTAALAEVPGPLAQVLTTGELVGHRLWLLEPVTYFTPLILTSIAAGQVWQPGEIVTGDPSNDEFGVHAHKATDSPAFNFYRCQTLIQPASSYVVRGTVWLWGTVIEHEFGYRASHAAIRSLDEIIPSPWMVRPSGDYTELLKELCRQYLLDQPGNKPKPGP